MAVLADALTTLSQRELVRILGLAYGDEARARRAIQAAVDRSAVRDVPTAGQELFDFVARELVPILTSDLGPRATIAVLSELETLRTTDVVTGVRARASETTRPPSEASSAHPRRLGSNEPSESGAAARRPWQTVLLVEAEPRLRTELARALIRRGCEVTSVSTFEDVREVLDGAGEYTVAIVDIDHAPAGVIVEAIGTRRPGVAIVARTADAASGRAMLEVHRIARFSICDRGADVDEVALLAAVDRGRG